jgi:quercetin dioxygenase-like cupin family protein
MKNIQSSLFQMGTEVVWEDAGPGVRRQVFGYDGRLMLVRVVFETGAVGDMHSHPHSQASYVESGVFTLTIGDQTQTLRAGDGYYVPSGVLHGCVCLEAGVLVDSFSPSREDFLPVA